MNRLLRSLMSFSAMVALLVPTATQAAYLPAPTNLEVVSGRYTNDATPTFTWSRSTGATWYEVAIDASTWQSVGNTTSYTSNTLSAGWHTMYLRARDGANNASSNTSITFEIDTYGPTVPGIWPTIAEEDEEVEFSVTPSGESAALTCRLIINGTDEGYMDRRNGTFYGEHTFSQNGSYQVYARCTDGDGNTTNGTTRTVTVSDEDGNDDTLSVPRVSPATATEDERVEISVRPTGTYNITSKS